MAIKLKGRAIFLHIPKTGGTWVEKVLQQLGIAESSVGHKHADLNRAIFPHGLKEAIPWTFHAFIRKLTGKSTLNESIPVFCFVRHPLTWYESWWKFNQKLNWPTWGHVEDVNNWHPCSALNGLGDPDFNRFIENVVSCAPGFVTGLFLRYIGEGSPILGRQESLEQDLLTILDTLGYRIDKENIRLPRRANESMIPANRVISWDDTLRSEVLKLEYPILRRCRYDDSERREQYK